MRILVTNDDGIHAEGIRRLAEAATEFGEVWVVAPGQQCSAMSQRITVHGEVCVQPADFPVSGVRSYRVEGTPADCVKIGLLYLMPEKPDFVFSGINNGYNAGYDIAYSGTVGAAMEALMQGVPAIAFSSDPNGEYGVLEEHLKPLTEELLKRETAANEIWNVNFPGCAPEECRGIREVRRTAARPFYLDRYERKELADGGFKLLPIGVRVEEAAGDDDVSAILKNYISIGKIRNYLMG